jgi:hypothetical protein
LIYWGNSSLADSVFKRQKRAIRLMMGYGYRESCRDLFKEVEGLNASLPLPLSHSHKEGNEC